MLYKKACFPSCSCNSSCSLGLYWWRVPCLQGFGGVTRVWLWNESTTTGSMRWPPTSHPDRSGAGRDLIGFTSGCRRRVCNGSTLITEQETVRGDVTALITNTVITLGKTDGLMFDISFTTNEWTVFGKFVGRLFGVYITMYRWKPGHYSIWELLLIQESSIIHSINHEHWVTSPHWAPRWARATGHPGTSLESGAATRSGRVWGTSRLSTKSFIQEQIFCQPRG